MQKINLNLDKYPSIHSDSIELKPSEFFRLEESPAFQDGPVVSITNALLMYTGLASSDNSEGGKSRGKFYLHCICICFYDNEGHIIKSPYKGQNVWVEVIHENAIQQQFPEGYFN